MITGAIPQNQPIADAQVQAIKARADVGAVRVPAVLCTLSRAVASLRLPGAAPNAANDLCIEVIPTVDAMGQALRSGIKWHAKRDDYDSLLPIEAQPDEVQQMMRALAQFENGL